jgi:hypothetical protein
MVVTDIQNAFNTMARKYIVDGVLEFCPSLLPYVASQYRKPSKLFYKVDGENKSRVIESSTGVRQARPCRPCCSTWRSCWWYAVLREEAGADADIVMLHDDLTIVGKQNAVAKTLRKLFEVLPGAGMKMNASKRKAYITEPNEAGDISKKASVDRVDAAAFGKYNFVLFDTDAAYEQPRSPATQQMVRIPLVEGVKVSGAAIGTVSYVKNELRKVVVEAQAQADAIMDYSRRELQCASLVHRACLPTKPIHLLRALPPTQTLEFAKEFNNLLLTSFKRMLKLDSHSRRVPRDERAEEVLDYQLLAPPMDGGWGLFDSEAAADICHVSSHCLTAPLIAAVPSLRDFYSNFDKISADTK